MRGKAWLVVVLFSSLVSAASAQTEFSGDIVDLRKPGTPVLAKLASTKDKRRLDIQQSSDEGLIAMRFPPPTKDKAGADLRVGGAGSAIILDLADHTSTILIPNQKVYYRGPSQRVRAPELYSLYAVVHADNVDDACTQWMKVPNADGETCNKVGAEKVNGRTTVKYDLSCYGETCHLWIDRRLHVIVKRETKWNSTELRNIQEIPPDYALFQVPADYTEQVVTSGVIQKNQPQ